EYAEFVHRYGFDLMNWPGYETLGDLRELMIVLKAYLPHPGICCLTCVKCPLTLDNDRFGRFAPV
ncbi:hypothetical protein ACWEN3_28010, partial [Streptomyces sp. NPDC004561]